MNAFKPSDLVHIGPSHPLPRCRDQIAEVELMNNWIFPGEPWYVLRLMDGRSAVAPHSQLEPWWDWVERLSRGVH